VKTFDLAISGAGLAGMALALDMAQHGQKVVLLERRSTVGGAIAGQITPLGPADNCPHLFLDSFTQCRKRLQSLGREDQLKALPMTFHVHWKNRWQKIALPERLPPPFALFTGGLPKGFVWGSRWLLSLASHQEGGSALDMLRRFHVSEDLLEFWGEWAVSVFNAPLDKTDGGLFLLTARRLFLKSNAFRPRVATCSLEELWLDPFRKALHAAGVELRTQTSVQDLRMEAGGVVGFQLRDGFVSAKRSVWAAPPWGLTRLPKMQEHAGGFSSTAWHPKRAQPIVHFLSDIEPIKMEQVKMEPGRSVPVYNGVMPGMMGFFGQPFQWLFSGGGRRVSLVGSALSGTNAETSDAALIAGGIRLLGLAGLRPRGNPVLLRRQHATLLPDADFEASRPGNQTPLTNLFCCGAWTKTDLPVSMESALESASRLATTLINQN
jgi:hydroxysqualene dehydroxylase